MFDTVVSEFWTVAVDQRTSGSYHLKEDKYYI